MKDLLEHLVHCHEDWQQASGTTEQFLARSMRRNLDDCRRLCESLQRELARPSSAEAFEPC